MTRSAAGSSRPSWPRISGRPTRPLPPRSWPSSCCARASPTLTPSRSSSRSARTRQATPRSPQRSQKLTADELQLLDPLDAVREVGRWRADAADPADSIGLADLLTNVVAKAADLWQDQPGDIIAALGHPRYVDGYLRGLAATQALRPDRAEAVVATALDTTGRPVEDIPVLGDEQHLGIRADLSRSWSAIEPAVIELLTRMWEQGLDLGGQDERAADFVLTRAASPAGPSLLPDDGAPLIVAMNRAYGRAWLAAAQWAYAHVRAGRPVPT